MKKLLTTIALTTALIAAVSAQPKGQRGGARANSESILLSKTTDGNCTICRYLVKESSPDNNEFSLRYKINLARLISTYDNNAKELDGLHNFISEIKQDSLKKITTVNVTGYASPDGPHAPNEKLAMARATDLREHINSICGMSDYKGTTTGIALSWSDARATIAASDIPQKQQVLAVIDSKADDMVIEQKLKALPEAWRYLVETLLPPMRCVELHIKYNSWRVVEERIVNRPAEPAEPQYIIMMIEEEPQNTLTHLPTSPLDYDNDKLKMKYKDDKRRAKYKEKGRMGNAREEIIGKRKY